MGVVTLRVVLRVRLSETSFDQHHLALWRKGAVCQLQTRTTTIKEYLPNLYVDRESSVLYDGERTAQKISSELALGCHYARREQFNWWLNPPRWKPPQVQVSQVGGRCSFQADQASVSDHKNRVNEIEWALCQWASLLSQVPHAQGCVGKRYNFHICLSLLLFLMLIIVKTVLLPCIVEIYCNDLRWGSTQVRPLWELKNCVFRLLLRALTLRQSTVFYVIIPKGISHSDIRPLPSSSFWICSCAWSATANGILRELACVCQSVKTVIRMNHL